MKGINEERLIQEITPKIEERMERRLSYRVIRSIIDTLEEEFYPPEEMIREEYIGSVKEAEKRIKKGQCLSFRNKDELKDYLDELGRG